jgi:uncharacterized protein
MNNITVLLTEKCNLNCSYCYQKTKYLTPYKNLIDDVIKFIHENYPDVKSINITGGEPLLEISYLIDLINKLNNSGTNISISTNGVLITDQILEFFNDNKIKLKLSIDGLDYYHDMNRKTLKNEGTFQSIWENVLKIKNYYKGIKLICHITLMPKILAGFTNIIKKLIEIGISNISFGIVVEDKWNDNEIKTFETILENISDLIISGILSNCDYIIDPIYSFVINSYKYLLDRNYRMQSCEAGNDFISILPDGSITPCGVFTSSAYDIDEIKIGDIKNGFSKECDFLKFDKLNEECYKCVLNDRCPKSCPAKNKLITGDFGLTSKTSCDFNKLMIKYSDRLLNKIYDKFSDFENFKRTMNNMIIKYKEIQ